MELKSGQLAHPGWTRTGWAWLTVSVLLVSFAQLALKYAMQQLPPDSGFSVYMELLRPANIVSVDLPVVLGIIAYLLSVICWLGTLARLPLSMAYPVLAISYLFVYGGAIVLPWFEEVVSATRLTGIVLVIAGVWLVSLPGPGEKG